MYINLKTCDEIVGFAVNNHFELEEYQGTLVDGYIIHADKKMRLGTKTANYIVIVPEFLNEWSSALKVRFINCEKRLKKLREQMS